MDVMRRDAAIRGPARPRGCHAAIHLPDVTAFPAENEPVRARLELDPTTPGPDPDLVDGIREVRCAERDLRLHQFPFEDTDSHRRSPGLLRASCRSKHRAEESGGPVFRRARTGSWNTDGRKVLRAQEIHELPGNGSADSSGPSAGPFRRFCVFPD